MKVIVSGSTGRVGQELIKLIQHHTNWQLGGLINRKGYSLDPKSPPTPLHKTTAQADVVVDFSLPDHLPTLTKFCAHNKLPLVSGTTGLQAKERALLDELAQQVPLLWAANMSLGIYFLHRAVQLLNLLGDDFKFTIQETHHIHKKDKPSGTALSLQQALQEHTGQISPLQAHRVGEVFGTHQIQAQSENEVITLRHEALNRSVFAHGALKAAQSLYKKPAGRYKLEDLL